MCLGLYKGDSSHNAAYLPKVGSPLSAIATSYCEDPLPPKLLNLSKLIQMLPKAAESQVHFLTRYNCSSSS